MIVKNGMPWVKYSLEAVRYIAHQIVVVDGGSTDGTVDTIKGMGIPTLEIVQGEWSDKTVQCNEYMKRATGDWVWQLDADEVYKEPELENAIKFLDNAKKDVYCVGIINFFRNTSHIAFGGMWDTPPVRVFRRKDGDLYCSHRPPKVLKIGGCIMASNGECIPYISIYHYSHVGVDQVRRKAEYYAQNMKDHPIYSRYVDWFNNVYLNKEVKKDLHITGGGDLSIFSGRHPEMIEDALKRGELDEYIT
ncbi:MAG: glycosyltransferase [Nitrospirae bacterium]|nr:glycosyltransferase [Nitrospirota bacterium]